MLRQLLVKNYAIIDEVTIHFSSGLNIITGETGAGKSILLGALGLVLGERADMSVLFNSDKKCIVEAEFDVERLDLSAFFQAHELDHENALIIRRELLPSERSRAFINDTPVKLKVLQELTRQLINVHRQFATLDIFRQDFQTKILDTLAQNGDLLKTYQNEFDIYRQNKTELEEVENRLAKASREQDFLRFQIDEINEVGLEPEKDVEIQEAVTQAEHAEEIGEELQALDQILQDDDGSVSDLLAQASQKVNHLLRISPTFQELYDRLMSVKIEIDELAGDLDTYAGVHRMDAEEVAFLKQRYDRLQRLYFKHQVNDSEELQALLNEMQGKIRSNEDDEMRRDELIQLLEDRKQQLMELAGQISTKRQKAIPGLQSSVEERLHNLAMTNASFHIDLKRSANLHTLGFDDISFLFNANPGTAPAPLQQVASGGELSRLSLSLKSIIAHELALPTMVFDEIDSGVSGDTALKMGRMLSGLGQSHQAIVITHSPQVAAQGNAHFYVHKQVEDGITKTFITELNAIDREDKIAVMLSSDPPSRAARKNARELLDMTHQSN